jgi:hypothetical protein
MLSYNGLYTFDNGLESTEIPRMEPDEVSREVFMDKYLAIKSVRRTEVVKQTSVKSSVAMD